MKGIWWWNNVRLRIKLGCVPWSERVRNSSIKFATLRRHTTWGSNRCRATVKGEDKNDFHQFTVNKKVRMQYFINSNEEKWFLSRDKRCLRGSCMPICLFNNGKFLELLNHWLFSQWEIAISCCTNLLLSKSITGKGKRQGKQMNIFQVAQHSTLGCGWELSAVIMWHQRWNLTLPIQKMRKQLSEI